MPDSGEGRTEEWKVEDRTTGKYYSTQLEVTLDDGRTVQVELSSDDPEPSWVEIARWDGGRAEFEGAVSDSHYERDATRKVADRIKSVLTRRQPVTEDERIERVTLARVTDRETWSQILPEEIEAWRVRGATIREFVPAKLFESMEVERNGAVGRFVKEQHRAEKAEGALQATLKGRH